MTQPDLHAPPQTIPIRLHPELALTVGVRSGRGGGGGGGCDGVVVRGWRGGRVATLTVGELTPCPQTPKHRHYHRHLHPRQLYQQHHSLIIVTVMLNSFCLFSNFSGYNSYAWWFGTQLFSAYYNAMTYFFLVIFCICSFNTHKVMSVTVMLLL